MGMDYLPGNSLHHFLKEKFAKGDRLTDIEASSLMKGILKGVAYVHSKSIVHRDLKPGNILIANVNDLSTVKLIDFGLGQ